MSVSAEVRASGWMPEGVRPGYAASTDSPWLIELMRMDEVE